MPHSPELDAALSGDCTISEAGDIPTPHTLRMRRFQPSRPCPVEMVARRWIPKLMRKARVQIPLAVGHSPYIIGQRRLHNPSGAGVVVECVSDSGAGASHLPISISGGLGRECSGIRPPVLPPLAAAPLRRSRRTSRSIWTAESSNPSLQLAAPPQRNRFRSRCTTSQHRHACLVMSRHVTSHHGTSRHVTARHVTPCHVTSCIVVVQGVEYDATQCNVMPAAYAPVGVDAPGEDLRAFGPRDSGQTELN